MRPTIINSSSNFVIITYWWGKGNLNSNTQRPCPEDFEKGDRMTKKPITYEQMIKRWKETCVKTKCNYMAIERKDFAVKGNYQKAINYKPTFILQALDACHPRAVVYIDGDMLIHRYPKLFDIENVDFMSQSWNIDPRLDISLDSDICFDPYVYETSGGLMYFNNTKPSYDLLKNWINAVKEFPLKADDRILSHLFNKKEFLLSMNIIGLPIEYLWFDMEYPTDVPKKYWDPKDIIVAHPECLTDEDRANAQGASADRLPSGYESQVSEKVKCRHKSPFYEYIFFDNENQVKTMHYLLKSLKQENILDIIPFKRKYGKYNNNYRLNQTKMSNLSLPYFENTLVHILASNVEMPMLRNRVSVAVRDVIPSIIYYLEQGNRVVFVPNGARLSMVKRVKKLAQNDLEFVCRNANTNVMRYKKSYTLKLDTKYPMYFGDSQILYHLLNMSKSLSNIGHQFSSTFMFLTRIRCKWV